MMSKTYVILKPYNTSMRLSKATIIYYKASTLFTHPAHTNIKASTHLKTKLN